MRKFYALAGQILTYIGKVNQFFIKQYQFTQFEQVGSGVYFGKNCTFTRNISIGDDVHIGAGCCFQSVHGEIRIGNHVMFGPEVHIHGGNHKHGKIGHLMKENIDKKPGEDGFVIIEDDVWIGARAIILKGVTIGRGSIIGAGAIVTKSLSPYSVYTGVPSAQIRQRWDNETVTEHEKILLSRNYD